MTHDQISTQTAAMKTVSENREHFDEAIAHRGVHGLCAILRAVADIVESDERPTGRLN